MKKQIVFIGSTFEELILNKNVLRMSFIESLWATFKTVNSKPSLETLITRLNTIENTTDHLRNNKQFLALKKAIKNDFDYESSTDLNERLTLFKKFLCKSMIHSLEHIDEQTCDLLDTYFSKSKYIFSYNSNFIIENMIKVESGVIVCADRQSFLLCEDNLRYPILYKMYGTCNQAETIVVTKEEKKNSLINLQMGMVKINQFEDISISLLGFNEGDSEFNDILNELASKSKTAEIFLFKPSSCEQEIKRHCISHKSGLKVKVIHSDIQTYVLERLKEKKRSEHIRKSKFLKIEEKEEVPSKDTVPPNKSRKKESKSKKRSKKKGSKGKERTNDKKTNEKRKQSKKSKKRPIRDKERFLRISYKTIMTVAGVLLCTLLFNITFSIATIQGDSMAPNYSSSDFILLNKQYNQVKRFDVIALKSPDESGQEYVKRVIGLPGDAIEYIEDDLYINGNLVEETYLEREKKKLNGSEVFTKDFSLEELSGVKEVPENKLFVLGDNRMYSRDSRNFGFIDVKDIKGDVKFKIWPRSR
ncbi:signal peptidase I [Enterococcus faecalis]|nr:signal peptidase I [Enterococcus faecalis]